MPDCTTCGGRKKANFTPKVAGEPLPPSPLGRFKVLRPNGIYYTYTTEFQALQAAERWGAEVEPM